MTTPAVWLPRTVSTLKYAVVASRCLQSGELLDVFLKLIASQCLVGFDIRRDKKLVHLGGSFYRVNYHYYYKK